MSIMQETCVTYITHSILKVSLWNISLILQVSFREIKKIIQNDTDNK